MRSDKNANPADLFPKNFSQEHLKSMLHKGHPRLFATRDEWNQMKIRLEKDRSMQVLYTALRESADEMLKLQPVERVQTGRRILNVSRVVLKRVLTLGLIYRLDSSKAHLQRAREELLQVAKFADWNPSHFLDTAEMTLAVAIGYDWLHAELSAADQATLRAAIINKGLEPGTGDHFWKTSSNNWNQVCYASMVAAALVVADAQPEYAVTFLRGAIENVHRPLDASRPDGVYPEGPAYWSYGTHFQLILISVLESALNETWHLEKHPAFRAGAVYINQMVGASGLFFNYADSGAAAPTQPALHWFAARMNNPGLNRRERAQLSAPLTLNHEGQSDRFQALALIWMSSGTSAPEKHALPLHWKGDGENPVAVHRGSFDPDDYYVAVKGGSPSVSHGHMDVGSFVLDWRGVRWAKDLGAQNYHDLESRGVNIWSGDRQDGDRWRVFRLNTLSHNTLVVDGEQQLLNGFAPITDFSGAPEAPFTTIDLTEVYRNSVQKALRRVSVVGNSMIAIRDEITGLSTRQTVRWGMVTEADVELKGNRAILRLKGKTLHACVCAPENAKFEIVEIESGPNEWDAPNPGTRMLAVQITGAQDILTIQVAFALNPLSTENITEIQQQ